MPRSLRSGLGIALAAMAVLGAGLLGTAAPGGGESVTVKSADATMTASISASARFINANHPDGGGYRAAIALYPACEMFQDGDLATPLLMLMGSVDDWTPPARCVQRGTALQGAGASVAWTIYPGAMHGFDQPGGDRTLHFSSHTYHMGYNATAAADAHTQVEQFLSAHLQ